MAAHMTTSYGNQPELPFLIVFNVFWENSTSAPTRTRSLLVSSLSLPFALLSSVFFTIVHRLYVLVWKDGHGFSVLAFALCLALFSLLTLRPVLQSEF